MDIDETAHKETIDALRRASDEVRIARLQEQMDSIKASMGPLQRALGDTIVSFDRLIHAIRVPRRGKPTE